MPKIKVEESHALGQELAIQRIKGLLDQLKADHGDSITDLKESWHGSGAEFSFKAMGMKVEGTINLTDHNVCFEGKIPLAALPFKSSIERAIREEARKLLV